MMSGRGTVCRVFNGRGVVLREALLRSLLILLLALAVFPLTAQPKQEIPPFLKHQNTPQTVDLNGKTYRLPNFSLAPVATGGREFVSKTPLGFLAMRETSKGFTFDLRRYGDVFQAAEYYQSTPNPLTVTDGLGRTANGPVFDFTKSAPHLAFFCRLEINENAGGTIPAKFRLGGVRHWQDDLGRRE